VSLPIYGSALPTNDEKNRRFISLWARSEVGLSRLPVTEEIAGSNPVGPAIEKAPPKCGAFSMLAADIIIWSDSNTPVTTTSGLPDNTQV
jgi:hypothetical protein